MVSLSDYLDLTILSDIFFSFTYRFFFILSIRYFLSIAKDTGHHHAGQTHRRRCAIGGHGPQGRVAAELLYAVSYSNYHCLLHMILMSHVDRSMLGLAFAILNVCFHYFAWE